MSKTTSIFSSERADIDSKEKEKEIFQRRAARKKEELKTDIQGLPYLMIGGTLVMALAMFVFSFVAFLYASPFFIGSIVGAFYIRESKMPVNKKGKLMKMPLLLFFLGLAVSAYIVLSV